MSIEVASLAGVGPVEVELDSRPEEVGRGSAVIDSAVVDPAPTGFPDENEFDKVPEAMLVLAEFVDVAPKVQDEFVQGAELLTGSLDETAAALEVFDVKVDIEVKDGSPGIVDCVLDNELANVETGEPTLETKETVEDEDDEVREAILDDPRLLGVTSVLKVGLSDWESPVELLDVVVIFGKDEVNESTGPDPVSEIDVPDAVKPDELGISTLLVEVTAVREPGDVWAFPPDARVEVANVVGTDVVPVTDVVVDAREGQATPHAQAEM